MTFLRIHRHALTSAAVMTLLLPMSAAIAADQRDTDHGNRLGDRPVTVSFTKWRVNVPADPSQPPFQFEGIARGRQMPAHAMAHAADADPADCLFHVCDYLAMS